MDRSAQGWAYHPPVTPLMDMLPPRFLWGLRHTFRGGRIRLLLR